MVVPSANGIDLLREHAFYEYGNKEFQSVLDFDYRFALTEFVNHQHINTSHIVSFLGVLATITSLYLLIAHGILNKKKIKNYTPMLSLSPNLKHQSLSSYNDHHQYDLEAGPPPSLSLSNSSTPSSSPNLSKEVHKIRTFRFDEYQPYKQA